MVDEVEVAQKIFHRLVPPAETFIKAVEGSGRQKSRQQKRLQQKRRRESWCNCVTAASASSPGALEEEEGWRDAGTER